MKTFQHSFLFFLIIIIEGYVVLSSELLAIRQTIPFVGSGTDTVSIIIAAVLMPLAFGYQSGGRFRPGKFMGRYYIGFRDKLILNIVISLTFLFVGLSYPTLNFFFIDIMKTMGIDNRLLQTTLYCITFLVVPVYLLGQTVPLISNYFSKQKLSEITGRILFVSTVGSFLGAVFSTIVLMSTLGVHHTVSLNFILLSCLVILLSKKKLSKTVIYCCTLSLFGLLINSDGLLKRNWVVKNNEHSRIQVKTIDGYRSLFLNRNFSSRYNDEGRKHHYIEFAERIAINPIINSIPPRDILVVGAGGFTFGHHDKNNNYIFVDINQDLQEIAERYILGEPIGDNKKFIPTAARGFLNETDQKFDVIYLDAYLGGASIPEPLITQDFFKQVKAHLKDGGILISNMILSPHFNNEFTRNVDNTFRSVFPHVSRHVIPNVMADKNAENRDMYSLWSESESYMVNVAYIYKHYENAGTGKIYTDNKNTVFYDKPKNLKN